MQTEKGFEIGRSDASRSRPLDEGRDVTAGAGHWRVRLRKKRLNYRLFEVTTPEGKFDVEYQGRGMAYEEVRVGGQVASRSRSTWWYTPCFHFSIGSTDAILAAGYWPWLTVRWLRLIVDGRLLYAAGSMGHRLPVDELIRVLSDPLTLDGIQIKHKTPASVPIPTNVTCERGATGVTLKQRWFSWMSVMTAPFCLVLDALVVAGYVLMPRGDLAPAWAVALLPGLLAGLFATYYVFARLLNHTLVTLTPNKLSILHRPVPWPGNRTIPIQHIDRFLCERRFSRDYAGDVWETYALSALLEDGRQVELLHKIASLSSARLLEQQVSGWLTDASLTGVTGLAA